MQILCESLSICVYARLDIWNALRIGHLWTFKLPTAWYLLQAQLMFESCSVLQCVAVRCSVLQCVAVCCGVLRCVAAGTVDV